MVSEDDDLPCPRLAQTHALADGELAGPEVEAARAHVAGCAICRAELADVLQVDALVAATQALPAVVPIARARRRRALAIGGGLAIAAAAAAALLVVTHTHTPAAEAPLRVAAIDLGLAQARQFEGRIAWAPAAAYRPYDVARGGEAHEAISLAALAALEQRGDLRGVAMAYLLDGDVRQARGYLAKAPDATLSDRAVLALADHDPSAAITLADRALAADPTDGAAQWNRALALRDLGLDLSAAAEFRRVADPAWASEARDRADKLAAGFQARAALVDRVLAHGAAHLTADDARELPGLSRLLFYDAVRSAPTAAAVRALAPIADALAPDLAALTIAKVAAADFRVRAPLAKTYADILAGGGPATPAARAAYLAALRAHPADAADILAGALVKLGTDGRYVLPAEMAEFTKLLAPSPDPWMRALATEQVGMGQLARGDVLAAATTMRDALAHCTVPFRCGRARFVLGDAEIQLQRFAEARAALAAAWTIAHGTGELLQEGAILAKIALVDMADDLTVSGLPLVRAYTGELLARSPDDCATQALAHADLASALANHLERAAARAELARITCTPDDDVFTAFTRVEIDRAPDAPAADVARARTQLAKLRASETRPSSLALLDAAEGRLLAGRDLPAARVLLRRAIAAADKLPTDQFEARRARAYAFVDLILAAAKAGDAAAALALLGEEAGNPPAPAGCALGIAVDSERRAFVTRGAAGDLAVAYDEARTIDASAAELPAGVLARLAGCTVVDVFARAPYHGMPRLLPDDVAWRYVSPRTHPVGAAGTEAVVVADAVPPAALELPRLASWDVPAGATLVAGARATPSGVLAAIAHAGDIVIDVHGIVDSGPDASYLALTPDADGAFALTPNLIRQATLTGNPIVVLAACHGSKGLAVVHEPWSLPAAFVFAGARAVVATPEPMPDHDSAVFFAELRAELGRSVPVAIAVRDLKVAWLRDHRGAWVRDLIVFE